MLQNASILHSTTVHVYIPLICYKSTFLQLINIIPYSCNSMELNNVTANKTKYCNEKTWTLTFLRSLLLKETAGQMPWRAVFSSLKHFHNYYKVQTVLKKSVSFNWLCLCLYITIKPITLYISKLTSVSSFASFILPFVSRKCKTSCKPDITPWYEAISGTFARGSWISGPHYTPLFTMQQH